MQRCFVTAVDVTVGANASASARTVLIARAAGLVVTFLGSIALARALGPEGRGAQGFFVATTVLLVAIAGLSLPVGDYILVTRSLVARRRLAVNAVWLAAAAGLAAGAVIVALQASLHILPPVLLVVPAWPLAVVLAVAGFAFNAHQIQLSLASGRALLGAFMSFGTYTIAAVGYVLILVIGGGLSAAVWMVVSAPYLTSIVASFARPPTSAVDLGRPDPQLISQTARVGIRFYPGELAAILHLRLDVILLGLLTPVSTVGVYVVAYQTAEPILVIASAASATILALGRGVGDGARAAAVARLIRETIVLGVVGCILAGVLAPFLLPLVYGPAFAGSVLPFLILLPSVLVLAIGRIALADLMRRNMLEQTVVVAVVALVTNLALNLALIPLVGAVGAALASMGSYSLYAVLGLALQRRASGLPWRAFMPGSADLASIAAVWSPKRLVARLGPGRRPPGGGNTVSPGDSGEQPPGDEPDPS